MGVKITADFTTASITKMFDQQTRLYLDSIVKLYSDAGKAMVKDARDRTKDLGAYDGGSFGNITWELRSSIGCAVYEDGVKKFAYFPALSTGGQGSIEGEDYADELSQGVDGIMLIVVVGKDYAAKVENRGYNVITSTGLIAEDIFDRYLAAA